jgi:MoxR-like ATPase
MAKKSATSDGKQVLDAGSEAAAKALFDPESNEAKVARAAAKRPDGTAYVPYVYTDDVKRAVRVARATRRPLLLRGEAGCGKSTLAKDVALALGFRYYEEVISSRTEARDLQYRFDAVRRLGDAPVDQAKARDLHAYLEPGTLWWAFDRESAARRGAPPKRKVDAGWAARDPVVLPGRRGGAVVLLDEIDKADPDVPNDLLVPLGENRFTVDSPTVEVQCQEEVMIFITTNGERDLPPAFLRRCVAFALQRPDPPQLKRIVAAHFGDRASSYLADMLARLEALTAAAKLTGVREPGTAELLDALQACVEMQIGPKHPDWQKLTALALWKHTEPPPGDAAQAPSAEVEAA